MGGLLLVGGVAPVALDAAVRTEAPEQYGFAIWPVDTAAEADEECSAFDRFTWRGSADATAQHFADDVLSMPDTEHESGVEGDSAQVLITGPGVDLPRSVGLRRVAGCWYVTSVGEREGFPAATVGYSGSGPDRRIFLHLMSGPSAPSGQQGSLGSGSFERRFDELESRPGGGGFVLTLPAAPSAAGHYWLGLRGMGDRPPALNAVEGGRIAPPFDAAALPEIPSPQGTRNVLYDSVHDARDCRGWYWEEYSKLHAIRQTLPKANHYGLDAPTNLFRREDRDTYVVTVGDRIDVTFEFWRPAAGCHVLGRISTSSPSSTLSQLRAGPGSCAFTIDWGRADEVDVTCGYGEAYISGTAARMPNPIQLGMNGIPGIEPDSVLDDPGRYLVAFYDNGELIGLEGGALPPLEH